jgi:hypothetical protein
MVNMVHIYANGKITSAKTFRNGGGSNEERWRGEFNYDKL